MYVATYRYNAAYKGQLQRENLPHVFIAQKSIVSHAECITTIFIILSCVVFKL